MLLSAPGFGGSLVLSRLLCCVHSSRLVSSRRERSDLKEFDALIFGIPTRYGSPAAQVKAFFDATGQLWMAGALVGKLASVFFSTSTQGGGQETTALTAYTNLVHHGMVSQIWACSF